MRQGMGGRQSFIEDGVIKPPATRRQRSGSTMVTRHGQHGAAKLSPLFLTGKKKKKTQREGERG